MNNNNNETITKKRFFALILISGIIALIILLGIFFLVKTSSKDKNKQTNKENNSKNNELSEQDQISLQDIENCPYLNKQNLTTWSDEDSKLCKMSLHKEDLPKWKTIPQNYIIKLWKKGYHWHDILQLWGWKIPETDIPDLKAEKEIGVINTLGYLIGLPCSDIEKLETMSEEEKNVFLEKMKNDEMGILTKTIFIVQRSSNPGINLDKKIQRGASPYDGNTLKYVEKLVKFTFEQENINLNQYEIIILNSIGAENFGKEGNVKWGNVLGKSIGTAYYLGLLSAVHRKPIAKSVAVTGFINTSGKKIKAKINDQEINIIKGDNLPIAGLKGKLYAATEKGVNVLVLSAYNISPNLLNLLHKTDYYNKEKKHITEEWSLAEDYSAVVPSEIREKMKVYWTKNISELRELILGGELS
jgi:hypothetical protein